MNSIYLAPPNLTKSKNKTICYSYLSFEEQISLKAVYLLCLKCVEKQTQNVSIVGVSNYYVQLCDPPFSHASHLKLLATTRTCFHRNLSPVLKRHTCQIKRSPSGPHRRWYLSIFILPARGTRFDNILPFCSYLI